MDSQKKLRILLLSSRNPYEFGGLGLDMMHMMERRGHSVDFMTLYGFRRQKSNMYSLYKRSFLSIVKDYLYALKPLKKIGKVVYKKIMHSQKTTRYIIRNGLIITNFDESKPFVDPYFLINQINGKYDLIMTSVWQDMITARTLKVLYDKFSVPILIFPADMFPMTGGCYYNGNCSNFEIGCGCCPILNSNNSKDQTHLNFQYKQRVYSNISCALMSNTYVLDIARRSHLFDKALLYRLIYMIDENVFQPHDIHLCRKQFRIAETRKFIMLARSVSKVHYPRKGINLLIDAINKFCVNKSKDQLNKIQLILIGDIDKEIENRIPIDTINLGMLDINRLIRCYSAVSVFLSPSIDDAGPSMVNQAIMCGTPTVAFHVGTAIDVIESKRNGYKAILGDTDDFANGIEYIYRLGESDYLEMRRRTRDMAVSLHSMSVNAKIVEEAYYSLLKMPKSS